MMMQGDDPSSYSYGGSSPVESGQYGTQSQGQDIQYGFVDDKDKKGRGRGRGHRKNGRRKNKNRNRRPPPPSASLVLDRQNADEPAREINEIENQVSFCRIVDGVWIKKTTDYCPIHAE